MWYADSRPHQLQADQSNRRLHVPASLRQHVRKTFCFRDRLIAPEKLQTLISKMAASISDVFTPRKTLLLGNICVICGFSFVQKIKESDGRVVVKKFLDRKYKLTVKHKELIDRVIGFEIRSDGDQGVCQKCFRTVERLDRTDRENIAAKEKLRQSAETVQRTLLLSVIASPRRSEIAKRMARSPASSQPAKRLIRNEGDPVVAKQPLMPITLVQPVVVKSFSDLTYLPTLAPRPTQVSKVMDTQPSKIVPAAAPTKPVRRSLGFTQSASLVPPMLQGEVEVNKSIQYFSHVYLHFNACILDLHCLILNFKFSITTSTPKCLERAFMI